MAFKTPLAQYVNTVTPADVAADVAAVMAKHGLTEIGLWVDDDLGDRLAPDETWVHVTTQFQAQAVLDAVKVCKLSLDNDLDGDEKFGQGKKVIKFICERFYIDDVDVWPTELIIVHTANPSAQKDMVAAIERHIPDARVAERQYGKSKPTFKLSPLN